MRNNVIDKILQILAVLLIGSIVVSCSTTRRLGAGEVRYTGVGEFDVVPMDSGNNEKLSVGLMDNLRKAANCDANDYVRAPFIKIPLCLWV